QGRQRFLLQQGLLVQVGNALFDVLAELLHDAVLKVGQAGLQPRQGQDRLLLLFLLFLQRQRALLHFLLCFRQRPHGLLLLFRQLGQGLTVFLALAAQLRDCLLGLLQGEGVLFAFRLELFHFGPQLGDPLCLIRRRGTGRRLLRIGSLHTG